MSLFIQKDAGSAGMGSVFPDEAGAHLIAISNFDSGYNETDIGSLIQVSYAQTTSGPCPDRLNLLVNTDFPTPSGTTDILVIASDIGFVLSDGTVVGPGITLRPGTSVNPANSVVVIYDSTDNNGQGTCVKGEGSSDVDVPSPPSVILYHELSHALRTCTNSALSLVASGCDASPEEHAAEVDENDMRDQLGIAHRDANDHCANVGCMSTTCCVVASVASGSPFSAQVNTLRELRDRFLRRSEVGFDFFERLHTDYYTFSPQVCDLMGRSTELKDWIGLYFVEPLTEILRLIQAYNVEGCGCEELGVRFLDRVDRLPAIAALDHDQVGMLEQLLGRGNLEQVSLDAWGFAGLDALIRERALRSEFVKWALVDTLAIYIEALRRRLDGAGPAELGPALAEAIDAWAARMPITEVWSRLSRHDRGDELEFLTRALLRAPRARAGFADRLLGHFAGDAALRGLLQDRSFLQGEQAWPS